MVVTHLLLVLEVWDGKPTNRKSWAGNLLVCSDLTFHSNIAKLKSAYNSLISGVDILILLFPASGITLGFRSFQGKVFILSLSNLVWVFIGLIACMGF